MRIQIFYWQNTWINQLDFQVWYLSSIFLTVFEELTGGFEILNALTIFLGMLIDILCN